MAFARRRCIPVVMALLVPALLGRSAAAQSILDRSPNLGQDWTATERHAALILSHRFEFMRGGDELLNVPTLTLGVPLPRGLSAGIDFTSNSEIAPARLGRNESQLWLGGTLLRAEAGALAVIAAWNHGASSADVALTGDVRAGRLRLLAAGRWFSNVFATGRAGVGTTVGAVLPVTPMLSLSADAGRLLRPDSVATVWSAGAAFVIPGSRHSVSIHASNGGATTLQGTMRPRVLGTESVRYGFTFTAPLGSRAQWAGVFRRVEPAAPLPADSGMADAEIVMADMTFSAAEVRIRAGQRVRWVNRDAVVHTASADDGSWGSTPIAAGESYTHHFTTPGRYPYHCLPHPHMRGVVIVD